MYLAQSLLPVAPRPYPDELLSSWVGRVAAHYHADADDLVAALVPDLSERPRDRRPFDLDPRDEIVAALAKVCRIDREAIHGLALARCEDAKPWRWLTWRFPHQKWPLEYSHEDLLFRGSTSISFCPECLYEDAEAGRDAYIRRDWVTASRSLCVMHAAHLRTSCPHCFYRIKDARYDLDSPLRITCFKCHKSLAKDAPRNFRSEGEKATYHSLVGGRRYLAAFEDALTDALCGRKPDSRWFGPAGPAEFVRVAEDLVQIIWGGAEDRPVYEMVAFRPLASLRAPLLKVSVKGSGWWPCSLPLTLLEPTMRAGLLIGILRILRLADAPSVLIDQPKWSPTFRWLYQRSCIYEHKRLLLDRHGWPRDLSDRVAIELEGVKPPAPPAPVLKPKSLSPEQKAKLEEARQQAVKRRETAELYLRVTKEVYTPEVQRSIAKLPPRERDRRLRAIMQQIRVRLAQVQASGQ